MVLGHVGGQLVDVAPVGGLLAGDGHLGGQDLQTEDLSGQGGGGGVWTEHEDTLHPHVEAGQVELLEGADWPVQHPIDHVDGAFLPNQKRQKSHDSQGGMK